MPVHVGSTEGLASALLALAGCRFIGNDHGGEKRAVRVWRQAVGLSCLRYFLGHPLLRRGSFISDVRTGGVGHAADVSPGGLCRPRTELELQRLGLTGGG